MPRTPATTTRQRPAARASDAVGGTLAEALIVRADLQRRIAQLKERLLRNAKVQEGDRPAEDPAQLMRELDDIAAQVMTLIQRINRTNSSTKLTPGMTIADAIARRDVLRLRHGIYRDLAAGATVTQGRATRSEVKFRATVAVSRVQKIADDLAREHRELDAKIQAANWNTRLEK